VEEPRDLEVRRVEEARLKADRVELREGPLVEGRAGLPQERLRDELLVAVPARGPAPQRIRVRELVEMRVDEDEPAAPVRVGDRVAERDPARRAVREQEEPVDPERRAEGPRASSRSTG
jgi:hypothetical protein